MTEPRRLLDGDGTGLEQELLSLSGGEALPAELSARMAAGFAGALDGLALPGDAGAATGGADALATGAAEGAASHMGAGAGAAGVTTGKLWILTGAGAAKTGIAGLALVGGVLGVNLALQPKEDSQTGHEVPHLPAHTEQTSESAQPEEAARADEAAQRRSQEQRALGEGTIGESQLEDSTITGEGQKAKKKPVRVARPKKKSPATSTGVTSPSVTSPSVTSPSVTSTLGAELALLDEVRGLLAAGKTGRAQQRLRAYGRRFPQGVLKAEAAVLSEAARKAGASSRR